MNTYVVGYDLNRPRAANAYPDLIKALQGFPNWWHHLDSTWVIKSSLTAQQIRDSLLQYIDRGDELLVVRLSGEGAWFGIDNEGSTWLMNNLTYS